MHCALRVRRAVAAILLAGSPLAGCGDDGSGSEDAGSTEATGPGTQGEDSTGDASATGTGSPSGGSTGAQQSCINIQSPDDAPCFDEVLAFVPTLAVAFGDFDGDARVDVASVTDPGGADPDGVQLIPGMGSDFGSAGAMSFAEPLEHDADPASLGALRVLPGNDVDRLFVQGTYGKLGSIAVDMWWSQNDGTFVRFFEPTSSPPTGPFIGDFDGDGHADLAFAPMAGDLSVIEIHHCQDGVCGAPETVDATGAPAGPWTVLPGDVDGDGTDELVVVKRTDEDGQWVSRAHVLLRQGDGFTAQAPVELGTDLSAFRLELVDLSGDGVVDLLAVGDRGDPSADDNATELYTFPGDGSGGFGAPETHTFQANLTGYGLGDLDGDGLPELFARIGDRAGVEVWRGTGSASFEPWFGLQSSAEPTGLSGSAVPLWPTRALDFDGDGDLDLLTVIGQGGSDTFAIALLYQK